MEGTADHFDALLRSGARRLTGYQRRLFQAEVATQGNSILTHVLCSTFSLYSSFKAHLSRLVSIRR